LAVAFFFQLSSFNFKLMSMDAVTEVKARINIEDVIGEYVQLKRAGKNYKGLSPFSNEKTPSFVVSPEKQIWHDFSSGRGGDIFTFIQEVEGLDFRATLELLARKAGVDLEQFETKSGKSRGPSKEVLYNVLEAATKFYQAQLPANQSAFEYVVKKRGFTKRTVIDFRIGYSPDHGDSLLIYLKKQGYDDKVIQAAGLTSMRAGRLQDMFRGRIMIPLQDQFGKVVGFTARILVDRPDAPKYINTPSTTLYDKSRHVYGLHLAKKTIQKEKFSVLAEGNLDVISSHQAGVNNVVATAGTALTQMQLKLLGRFSPDVRLAFDEDRAGIAATERAIPIAATCGVQLSVVTIPSGKDPDELVRSDPEVWKEVINKADYAVDWVIKTYQKNLNLSDVLGKKQFASAVLPVIKGLTDKIEQDHYIQQIAGLLGSDPENVKSQMYGKQNSPEKRLKQVKTPVTPVKRDVVELNKTADRLLALIFSHKSLRGSLVDLTPVMFEDPMRRRLVEFLLHNPEFNGGVKESKDLKDIVEYVKIITLQFEELYADVDQLELQLEVLRLKSRYIELYVKDQKKQIVEQLQSASDAETNQLLMKVRELDQLLSRGVE